MISSMCKMEWSIILRELATFCKLYIFYFWMSSFALRHRGTHGASTKAQGRHDMKPGAAIKGAKHGAAVREAMLRSMEPCRTNKWVKNNQVTQKYCLFVRDNMTAARRTTWRLECTKNKYN
jgi:hypothetical protein